MIRHILHIHMLLVICVPFCLSFRVAAENPKAAYLNDPFTRPGVASPLTLPEAWPIHFDRSPIDRSPPSIDTKLIVFL